MATSYLRPGGQPRVPKRITPGGFSMHFPGAPAPYCSKFSDPSQQISLFVQECRKLGLNSALVLDQEAQLQGSEPQADLEQLTAEYAETVIDSQALTEESREVCRQALTVFHRQFEAAKKAEEECHVRWSAELFSALTSVRRLELTPETALLESLLEQEKKRYEARIGRLSACQAGIAALEKLVESADADNESVTGLFAELQGALPGSARELNELGEFRLTIRNRFLSSLPPRVRAALQHLCEQTDAAFQKGIAAATEMDKAGLTLAAAARSLLADLAEQSSVLENMLRRRLLEALAAAKKNYRNTYALTDLSFPAAAPGPGKEEKDKPDYRDWSIYGPEAKTDRTRAGVQFRFLAEVFPEVFRSFFPTEREMTAAEKETAGRMIDEFEKKTGRKVILSPDGCLPLHVVLYYLCSPMLQGGYETSAAAVEQRLLPKDRPPK